MAQFSADIAGMLEILAFALGLYLWHLAAKENAAILRLAAAVLVAGAVLVGACTTYYWVRYQQQGAFGQPSTISSPIGFPMQAPRSGMSGGLPPMEPMQPGGTGR